MKKLIATLTALAAAMTMSVFAEGYICGNDLEKGSIDMEKAVEDGFVLIASLDKPMEIKTCDTRTVGEDTFTQVISTKGSGSAKKGERTITFPAKAGEKITFYANNSGSGSRPLHVVNMETMEEVALLAVTSFKEGDVFIESVPVTADGTYGCYSTSGGMYIYQIKVGK